MTQNISTIPLIWGNQSDFRWCFNDTCKRERREGLANEYLDKPAWSREREASFGLGLLDFQNSTHARWEWHRNQDRTSEVSFYWCDSVQTKPHLMMNSFKSRNSRDQKWSQILRPRSWVLTCSHPTLGASALHTHKHLVQMDIHGSQQKLLWLICFSESGGTMLLMIEE